jgi:hypothetical protein
VTSLVGDQWSASRPSSPNLGKSTPYPSDRKLGRPKSQSGRRKGKKRLAYIGIRTLTTPSSSPYRVTIQVPHLGERDS